MQSISIACRRLPIQKELRINGEITAPFVRVIEEGAQVGVLSLKEALERAARAGYDLVEVAPLGRSPSMSDHGLRTLSVSTEQKAPRCTKEPNSHSGKRDPVATQDGRT